MSTVIPNHVQRLASIVRRLKPDELRQLVELVPELKQVGPERVAREEQAAVAYSRQAAASLSSQDEFIDGLSYEAYLALLAAEQNVIWERILAETPTGAHDLEHKTPPASSRTAERVSDLYARYPDEWILFDVVEEDELENPVTGVLVAHSPDCDPVWDIAIHNPLQHGAVFYTGEPAPAGEYVLL